MKELTALQASLFCDGEIICGNQEAVFNGICIDSRHAQKGQLFVALKGESTDGHKYISKAVEGGCTVVLSQKNEVFENCTVIKVHNTLKAFHKIAEGYRKMFSLKVIGVTGSVGKTTTKEFIYAVLAGKYNTLKSLGNYNSETGMPLTAFNIEDSHEAVVFEMGMDAKGEIAALTKIARPEIAVITNIGVMHIEHLGSKENILQAKLEIERGLNRNGIMVLNGDDEMLWAVKGKLKHKTVYYGIENKNVPFRAENITTGQNLTCFDIITPVGSMPVRINTEGRHNVLNALAAVVVGMYNGISLEDCVNYLLSFENAKMRQRVFDKNGVTIIDDCYNAGPDSMKAALSLMENKKHNRIAVLSDMLELGDFSERYHREIGETAAKCCDILITFGNECKFTCEQAINSGMSKEKVFCCADSSEATAKLLSVANKGDTVLFKGSRGMKTETVLQGFEKGWM